MQGEETKRLDFREMTVLGAAFAAGIPVDMWKDTSHFPTSSKYFTPNMSSSDSMSLYM